MKTALLLIFIGVFCVAAYSQSTDRAVGIQDVYLAKDDGKGQPGQIGSVSHGCVPARFRNINVINTGRKA